MFRKSRSPYVLEVLGLLFGLVAADGQTIQPPYSSSYTLVSLGGCPPAGYCALAFLNPSTLMIGAGENGQISSFP